MKCTKRKREGGIECNSMLSYEFESCESAINWMSIEMLSSRYQESKNIKIDEWDFWSDERKHDTERKQKWRRKNE